MKKLERLPPPEWDISKPEIQEKIRGWYAKIPPKGDIPAHWNDKNSAGEKPVRKQLLTMSDNHCAYCGKYISNEDMDVEHYLPQSIFREIAYAWLNYLPSCIPCNRHHKKAFIPPSLEGKRIVDAIIHDPDTEPQPDFVLDANYSVHKATTDRIIDPSFDDPEKHLEFDVVSSEYLPLTEIGRTTIEQLFSGANAEVQREWSKCSIFIRKCIKDNASKEIIADFIICYGYEYIGWKAYQFWSEIYGQGLTQE